jgi:hypothetical protein
MDMQERVLFLERKTGDLMTKDHLTFDTAVRVAKVFLRREILKDLGISMKQLNDMNDEEKPR